MELARFFAFVFKLAIALALFGAVEGSLAEGETRITRIFVSGIEHSSILATAERLAERAHLLQHRTKTVSDRL